MGLYRNSSDEELKQLRAKLFASLHERLTGPTSATVNGRGVQYQQRTDELRTELAAIDAEITRRTGGMRRGPIYIV
ncbi:hypothetical protein [Pseudacidovorax intermedius]|uniref:GpW protein n=1 Tax=Pseudacidovorax intermedius TaxID=433924 RepID=A0A147GZW7_9BURK|nr:hypothetical protein [Pseudacidovorax intermedius]KTT23248.1 hypothetical protein NS331_08510 [Pseudacidovorax intermedius]